MEFNPCPETNLLLQEQFIDSTSSDIILTRLNENNGGNKNYTELSPANLSACDPPTHKAASIQLDRAGGVSKDPIGPRRRARRGPTPRTPQQQARSVARRNARERKRVRLVNLGFATLRDHIPPEFGTATAAATPKSKNSNSNRSNSNNNSNSNNSNNKKLSKVETLRCAIEYIKQLREAIGFDDKDSTGAGSTEGFSSSSSPPEFSGSSPSYCTTPSPVMMLMSGSRSPPMFHDDADDFLDIMDWTTL